MRKFIKTIFVLIFPVVVLCVIALGVEIHVYRMAMRQPDCTIGIIGDSRVQCNVNPEFFPGLANFGQRTSQSMVWKAKLETILALNPQITTFIIELSPICYMRRADKTADERARFTRGHIPATILLDIVNTKEMGGLPSSGMSRNFIRGVLFPFLSRCLSFSEKSPLQEGYYPLHGKVQKSQRNMGYGGGGAFSMPKDEKNLIRKDIKEIISVLKSHKIRIVLMTAPVWPYEDAQLLSDKEWDFFASQMEDLCRCYGCKWVNYRKSIPDDEFWADSGHLNVEGAGRFTRMIKSDYDAGKW